MLTTLRRLLDRLREVPPEVDRPGRNEPCHCGSGEKYKKCCLRADEREARKSYLASRAARLNRTHRVSSRVGMAQRGLGGHPCDSEDCCFRGW